MRPRHASSLFCGVLLCTSGCAFFGKSEPLAPRYYSAEVLAARSDAPAAEPGVSLRLGRIGGASYLRERIAYRTGEREIGLYEERRWTERPEEYLRRGLARVLFEERGMQRAISGIAPTLDVELTAFEELRAPKHGVRVRARVVLIDQRTARFEHTFGAEAPVAGDDDDEAFGRVAEAFAVALGRCIEEIADRVVAELRAQPEPEPVPAPPSAL